MFNFSTTLTKNRVEVHLQGDLDIDGTEIVEQQLIPLLGKYEIVSINFKNVPFVDSSGIGLLISMVQALQDQNIKITIFNLTPDVLEVFELLQIPDILGDDVFV